MLKKLFFAALCLFGTQCSIIAQTFPTPERLVSNFSLMDVNAGKTVSLSDYPNAKGFIVIFTCNHCPFAKLYTDRLNEMSVKYAKLGVPLLAVNPMDTVVYEEEGYMNMLLKARTEHFNFPYLFDSDQLVGKDFKVDRTPHAFVVWKSGYAWAVKYNGAIDDNGSTPSEVTHNYIAEAIDELLQNKAVSTPETKSIGCAVRFRK